MATSSALLERYLADGFLRLPGIFAPKDIDLAIAKVAPLPDWIRRKSGDPNIQRLQPLQTCEALDDPGWIRMFYGQPRLEAVLDELFRDWISPAPRMSRDLQLTGLFIDPLDRWWSTGLHRDYRDFVPGLDVAAWRRLTGDLRLFNQINIPLVPDSSLWVVPGSHKREDSAVESDLVRSRDRFRGCRSNAMEPREVGAYRRELLAGLEACAAVNLVAEPGDLVLYRSNILHCGVYEPGARRLTLHDAVYSAQWHRYVLETFHRPFGGRLSTL